MFRTLFTSLVLAVSTAAAAALVYAILRIARDGVDLSAAVAGVSGVVGSGGAVFLGQQMRQTTRVAEKALADVAKYCGTVVTNQVS